jgi:acyl-CoA synthetase (NDP forming)
MDLVEFTDPTLQGLRALSPEWMGVGNPFDIWPGVSILGRPRTEVERQGLQHVLSDPGVDAALMVLGSYDPHLGEELEPMVREAAQTFPDKPLVFFAYGPHFEEVRRSIERTGTALVFPSPERAARALMHLRARARHLAARMPQADA